jgi:hypothetical protein
MKKAIISAVVIVLAVIVVDVAVNSNDVPASSADSPSNTHAAPTPVLGMNEFDPQGGGMEALVGGTLIVEGSCVYIESGAGNRTAPIFPYESAKWEDDGLVFSGKRYEVGEPIQFGGGERPFRNLGTLHQDLLPECRTPKVWIVAPR